MECFLLKHVRLDLTASGKVTQYAVALDIVLSMSMALAITLFPGWLPGPIVTDPSTNTSTMPSTCQCIRTIIRVFATKTVLAIPNASSVVESWRFLLYQTVLTAECPLAQLFLYKKHQSAELRLYQGFMVVIFFSSLLVSSQSRTGLENIGMSSVSNSTPDMSYWSLIKQCHCFRFQTALLPSSLLHHPNAVRIH